MSTITEEKFSKVPLIGALREGLVSDLLKSSNSLSWSVTSARLVKRMQEDLGTSPDVAQWVVNSWALALEVISKQDIVSNSPPPVDPKYRQEPIQQQSNSSQSSPSRRSNSPPPVPSKYRQEPIQQQSNSSQSSPSRRSNSPPPVPSKYRQEPIQQQSNSKSANQVPPPIRNSNAEGSKMKWFYCNGNVQNGPISDQQL